MDVWVVEQRWEDDGLINRRLRHIASSPSAVEEWIDDHPDLDRDRYWFAAWSQPVDEAGHRRSPDQFYSRRGERLNRQPIDHNADNRRAEQAGLSPNIPGEEGSQPHTPD